MFKIKHLFHGEVLKEYITTRKLAIIQRFIKSLKNGAIWIFLKKHIIIWSIKNLLKMITQK